MKLLGNEYHYVSTLNCMLWSLDHVIYSLLTWLFVNERSVRFSHSLNNFRGNFLNLLHDKSRYLSCTISLKCRYVMVLRLTLIRFNVVTFMNLSKAFPGSVGIFWLLAANKNSTAWRLISDGFLSASSSFRMDNSQQIPCAVEWYRL